MKKTLLIVAAMAALGMNAQTPEVKLRDITPAGYDFSKYNNGDQFTVHPSLNAAWSPKAGLFDQEAYTKDGQFTVFYHRGVEGENTADFIAKDQAGITVRDFGGYLGKCLVINQAWSPLVSNNALTTDHPELKGANVQNGGTTSQGIAFYISKEDIPHNWSSNAMRVRVVFDILYRGCHAATAEAGMTEAYTMNDVTGETPDSWYRPSTEYSYADGGYVASITTPAMGSEFAKWENEGTTVAQIPAEPTILKPTAAGTDPLDNTGHTCNGVAPAYFMQLDRFMVYEWDTYAEADNENLKIVMHFNNHNMSIIIKEVKFFAIDNASDIAETEASLLNKRAKSWRYYTEAGVKEFEEGAGVDNIAADDTQAPAEYYNLQGMRVANPGHGLYIKRQGDKATKVIL